MHLSNVVVRDGERESEKEILIRHLIVLNTPDDDPDDETIIVNKAVVVPSVDEDRTLERLKRKMMRRATMKFNSQLDELSRMLSAMKFTSLPPKKSKKKRRKREELREKKKHKAKVKKQLKKMNKVMDNLEMPIIKKKRTIKDLSEEIMQFDRSLDSEIQSTFDSLEESKKKHQDLKSMMTELHGMKQQMKSLKMDFTRKMGAGEDSEAIGAKIQSLAKNMNKLNSKMQGIKLRQKHDIKKAEQHHQRLRDIMYKHGRRVEDVFDKKSNRVTEHDFKGNVHKERVKVLKKSLKSKGFMGD